MFLTTAPVVLMLLLWICVAPVSSADTQAIRGLLELTWSDPPKEIDLIVVQRRIGRQLNRDTERAFLDRTFAAFPQSHPMKRLREENAEEYYRRIEETIDDAIFRKEAPQIFRYRYRVDQWDGEPPRFRRDRLKHNPDQGMQTDDIIESLDPLDSWVNVGDIVDGYSVSLCYERGANRLDRFLNSDKPKWSTNDLWRLWGPSGGVWLLLRNSCGGTGPDSAVTRDTRKEEELIAGTHEQVIARQSTVTLDGEPVYVIDLFLRELPQHPLFKVWSNSAHPSNVFRVEGFDPKTGQLTSRCEMQGRDAEGLVHSWKEERVEGNKTVQLDEYRILRVISPPETSLDIFREDAFERTFTLTHYPDRIVTTGPNGAVSVQSTPPVPPPQPQRTSPRLLIVLNVLVIAVIVRTVMQRKKQASGSAKPPADSGPGSN